MIARRDAEMRRQGDAAMFKPGSLIRRKDVPTINLCVAASLCHRVFLTRCYFRKKVF